MDFVDVFVDLRGTAHRVGRLWMRGDRGRDSATFEYAPSWLAHPERFALEPALSLRSGPHYTPRDRAVFGSIGDSAPDRWGRTLIRRAEIQRAAREGRPPRSLLERDYLFGVSDVLRQGALRFADEAGRFLSPDTGYSIVPPLVHIRALLDASLRLDGEREKTDDIGLLLAPGSSLGGARPKAAVLDSDGSLAIAKFPKSSDDHDICAWEDVSLTLAGMGGIVVPPHRLEKIGGRNVLIERRFDRDEQERIPFISAMTMLEATDGERRSYPEIADALSRTGSSPKADIEQIFRRMVFSVLSSNFDDHLRNHGFLYDGRGWKLSPAYDLNPVPDGPRHLSTALDLDDTTASLDVALRAAPYFDMSAIRAREIAEQVALPIAGWKREAEIRGIKASEIEALAPAFDTQDLARLLAHPVSVAVPSRVTSAFGHDPAAPGKTHDRLAEMPDSVLTGYLATARQILDAPSGRRAKAQAQLDITVLETEAARRGIKTGPKLRPTISRKSRGPSLQ